MYFSKQLSLVVDAVYPRVFWISTEWQLQSRFLFKDAFARGRHVNWAMCSVQVQQNWLQHVSLRLCYLSMRTAVSPNIRNVCSQSILPNLVAFSSILCMCVSIGTTVNWDVCSVQGQQILFPMCLSTPVQKQEGMNYCMELILVGSVSSSLQPWRIGKATIRSC